MSSNVDNTLWRVPGVMGLNLRSAICLDVLVEVNHFSFGQADDGLLITDCTSFDDASLGVTLAALAVNTQRSNRSHGYTELLLYCFLNLHLIRTVRDNKAVGVVLLGIGVIFSVMRGLTKICDMTILI